MKIESWHIPLINPIDGRILRRAQLEPFSQFPTALQFISNWFPQTNRKQIFRLACIESHYTQTQKPANNIFHLIARINITRMAHI